ncbi:MAG: FAD:protein FMN transferase [Chloroflexi bacterium]|nr:FAD:protein FMN transferase [Chloroflexota bacterium]
MSGETPPLNHLFEAALNFRAMNTTIELLIYAPTDKVEEVKSAGHQIKTLFVESEATLSRFRPESELSKLNRQGYLENSSALLYENVAAAWQMRDLTSGIFDPTILDALEAAGYDRSFELLKGGLPQLFTFRQTSRPDAWYNSAQAWIKLDPLSRSIQLAPGLRLDLGGIAKGSTATRAVELLRHFPFSSFMLNAGGDMYLHSSPPQNSQGWRVDIANEALGATGDITSFLVINKAVATSSTTGRQWRLGGQSRHHLIDPRTRQPTNNGLAAATVVAETVQMADVMAKTALILFDPKATQQAVENLLALKQTAGLDTILLQTAQGELIEL